MQCAKCSAQAVGKSKYCRTHRADARAAWKALISESNDARESKRSEFQALYNRAWQAGFDAARAAVSNITPMVVTQHSNPLNDNSPVVRQWVVPAGACGFAWVNLRPGNSSLARWLVAKMGWRKSYSGGIQMWVNTPDALGAAYGQSIEVKEAFAQAFAQVLREAGYNAYADSRLD